MGELHLEIIVDRLKREFNVDANVGRPQVAYRETISQPAEKIQGKFVRQTGGSGQYGDASSTCSRRSRAPATSSSTRSSAARSRRSTSSRSTRASRRRWAPASSPGYPVVDVKVELIDGSYHDVDSSERAFKIAGSMAFKEAMKRAKPKLLEPVMAVEVTTPEDYLGDVIGNLNSRRGRIESMNPLGNAQVVKAIVPLSRDVRLRHRPALDDAGAGDFTMQFDRYEEVPQSIASRDRRAGRRRLLTRSYGGKS